MTRATVKGDIFVAMLQGAAGGLVFAFLGVHASLLWAVLMAFFSLLPAIGSALVRHPVALYFLATGATWKGIVLIVYGLLVIGLVDNLLRPPPGGAGDEDACLVASASPAVSAAAVSVLQWLVEAAVSTTYVKRRVRQKPNRKPRLAYGC